MRVAIQSAQDSRAAGDHGNERWRWRVIDIPASVITVQGAPPVRLVAGFMREQCLALFHSS